MKVQNMKSSNGNTIANQFRIDTENGTWFQSYDSIIVFIPKFSRSELIKDEQATKIQLDSTYWDYSKTTGKYRNLFLVETKAETLKKIASGEYILADLN